MCTETALGMQKY